MAEATTTTAPATTGGDPVQTSQAAGAGADPAASQVQTQGTQPQTQAPAQGGTAAPTFTPEQQAHIDQILKDRLAAEQSRQQKKIELEKQQAAEAALAEQGKFQDLAEQRRIALEAKEAELRDERTRNQMLTLAAKHSISDSDFVFDAVKGKVEYDADGKPSNLGKLVEEAVKRIPGLVQPGGGLPSSGGRTNTGKTDTSAGSFTRQQIADPTFFQANKDAIMLAAKEGRITDE
jgi:hypothetical protein